MYLTFLLVSVLLLICIPYSEAAFQPFQKLKSLLGRSAQDAEGEVIPQVANEKANELVGKAEVVAEDGNGGYGLESLLEEDEEEEDPESFPSSYPHLMESETDVLMDVPDQFSDQASDSPAVLRAAYSYSYNSDNPSKHPGVRHNEAVLAVETKMAIKGVKVSLFTLSTFAMHWWKTATESIKGVLTIHILKNLATINPQTQTPSVQLQSMTPQICRPKPLKFLRTVSPSRRQSLPLLASSTNPSLPLLPPSPNLQHPSHVRLML